MDGITAAPTLVGICAIAIGKHVQVFRHVLVLGPGAHDEGVVHREADDLVHALGADGGTTRAVASRVNSTVGTACSSKVFPA